MPHEVNIRHLLNDVLGDAFRYEDIKPVSFEVVVPCLSLYGRTTPRISKSHDIHCKNLSTAKKGHLKITSFKRCDFDIWYDFYDFLESGKSATEFLWDYKKLVITNNYDGSTFIYSLYYKKLDKPSEIGEMIEKFGSYEDTLVKISHPIIET